MYNMFIYKKRKEKAAHINLKTIDYHSKSWVC